MEFSDQNFEQEVLNFPGAVLVDFFATWCGPCQVQGTIIEELMGEMKDKPVKIGKVNVDQAPNTAEKFNVMSIPTLVFLKNGKAVETLTGLQGKEGLKEKLLQLI
jgi:thioredoxin 1